MLGGAHQTDRGFNVEFIGDLERAFAAAIYPNRVLFAIVAAIAVAGIVVLAWRRRWDVSARRHPARTVAGIVGLAVIVGPIAWYLGSPLFISTTIDEPAPVAAASTQPSPIAPSPNPSPRVAAASPSLAPSPTPSPSPSPVPIELTGSFTGADDFHFGRGTARLIETSPGSFTVRLEDFAVRNGPDLFVYLSPSSKGYAKGAVELGRLKADRGNQNYAVPADVDVSEAKSVVIWCKQFSVLFATAPLA
jgi:hypothetical protein